MKQANWHSQNFLCYSSHLMVFYWSNSFLAFVMGYVHYKVQCMWAVTGLRSEGVCIINRLSALYLGESGELSVHCCQSAVGSVTLCRKQLPPQVHQSTRPRLTDTGADRVQHGWHLNTAHTALKSDHMTLMSINHPEILSHTYIKQLCFQITQAHMICDIDLYNYWYIQKLNK